MILTYQELRQIKDNLPDGSIHKIADRLGVSDETVRNYFGGYNFSKGETNDVHFETGINGGFVKLEDAQIFNEALKILSSSKN